MGKRKIYLDFEIDKLTNSIENTISGDSFATDVAYLTKPDLKYINKKNLWLFDWGYEHNQPERDVYKLTILNNNTVVQGIVSLTPKENYVFINLIENAPFNKGKTKLYSGVAGNLVAYACKLSFARGFDGYVSFLSKTNLIAHYKETLGAISLGGNLMSINTVSAKKLIEKYFK